MRRAGAGLSLGAAAALSSFKSRLERPTRSARSGGGKSGRGSRGKEQGSHCLLKRKWEPWVGKEELALLTFLREKFSQGVLFVQTRPGEPGDALPAWRRCLGSQLLAPLLLLPAWGAPLPPREAPNGYPVSPTGRRLQRRLPPPKLPAAART